MSQPESRRSTANRNLTHAVHIVPPTPETAMRLWQLYQRTYRDDEDLVARVCDSEDGIDGLTEDVTPAEVLHVLQMPDTVAFVAVSEKDTLDGFLIVSYASGEKDSRERFKNYFLGEVFQSDALRFQSSQDEAAFRQIIDRGYVAYFAEFVALGGRAVSGALMLAAYQEICVRRHTEPSFAIVGKCLDSARIGRCTNSIGNRPVKAMAEALDLVKIAVSDQIRTLRGVKSDCLARRAFPHETSVPETVNAVLTFALYCGSAQRAVEAMTARA